MTRAISLPAEAKRFGPFDLLPRHMRRPGQLLTMTWQAPVVHGVTPIWEERIRGYWERIEQRYGVIVSEPRNVYDDATGTITTFAALTAVMDGVERVPMGRSLETH